MMCFTCKGNVEESTTTYMTEYNNCYIIIKNVPCKKYLNGVTLKKIETILEKLKTMLTEFAVVDYNKAAQA